MTNARRLHLLPLAFIACLFVFTSAAKAETITFDSLEQSSSPLLYMNSYTEGGFAITDFFNSTDPFRFASGGQHNGNVYAGSAGLWPTAGGQFRRIRLANTTGASFSLNSIDLSLAQALRTGFPETDVTFTGHYADETTTSQTFVSQRFGFQTFTFDPSFSNLAFVEVTWVNSDFQMDNVVLNGPAAPVPESASIVLLGIGLLGLFVAMRKHSAVNSRQNIQWEAERCDNLQ